MRADDNGKLTSADRTKSQQPAEQAVEPDLTDKHNANTAHYGNNEVGQRRE